MTQRYMVLFKTHFWDAFTERQFRRLEARAPGGRLMVAVDETHGPVEGVTHDGVLRMHDSDFESLGLAYATTDRSLLWYNTDYPHYLAFEAYPDYDYYVTVEYDALADVDLDRLIAQLAADGVDYLGFPLRTPPTAWPWFDLHTPVYRPEQILTYLSCFAVFSRRAMDRLFARRREMSTAFQAGRLAFWPNNEAFIPTEMSQAGFRIASLSAFGATDRYDWWPPQHEAELETVVAPAFVHPVLEGDRYLRSILRHERRLSSLVDPESALRRRLRPYSRAKASAAVRTEVKRRAGDFLGRGMHRLGLAPHWAKGAAKPTD